MGELDDALAGLRAEVLAATATDFEAVRRARRSRRARRATASALALVLIGGGATLALAGGGLDRDDSIRYLDPTPSATPTAAPTATGSGVPVPEPTALPTVSGPEHVALQIAGDRGVLLLKRCDGDHIECTLAVRLTDDGGQSFGSERVVAQGVQDPDSVDASDRMAGDVLLTTDAAWLWGPSLFRSTDRRSWKQLAIRGVVAGLLHDATRTVAVVERCAATFPTFTSCALVTVDVTDGAPRDVKSVPIEDGSYVASVAGDPSALVVELGQEDGISHEVVGSATSLTLRRSVCAGRAQAVVVQVDPGFTAFCGDQPTGTVQVTERFLSPDLARGWTSAGSTDLRGHLGAVVRTPYGLLALPGRGPVQLSDEGQTWRVVLPEVDGDTAIGWDVAVSSGRLTLLSGPDATLWDSSDGVRWESRRLRLA